MAIVFLGSSTFSIIPKNLSTIGSSRTGAGIADFSGTVAGFCCAELPITVVARAKKVTKKNLTSDFFSIEGCFQGTAADRLNLLECPLKRGHSKFEGMALYF
jgi:hypothetical protein